MDTSFTNSRASIATARRADTDWTSLTTDQRIRSIELDGYVVIPDLLSAAQLEAIRDELVAMFLPAITIAGSLTLALGAEPVPDTFAGLAHEYEARTRPVLIIGDHWTSTKLKNIEDCIANCGRISCRTRTRSDGRLRRFLLRLHFCTASSPFTILSRPHRSHNGNWRVD